MTDILNSYIQFKLIFNNTIKCFKLPNNKQFQRNKDLLNNSYPFEIFSNKKL